MAVTPNIGLKLFDPGEKVKVSEVNSNSSIIDDKVGGILNTPVDFEKLDKGLQNSVFDNYNPTSSDLRLGFFKIFSSVGNRGSGILIRDTVNFPSRNLKQFRDFLITAEWYEPATISRRVGTRPLDAPDSPVTWDDYSYVMWSSDTYNKTQTDSKINEITDEKIADKLSKSDGITILDPQKDSGTVTQPIVNLLGYMAAAIINDRINLNLKIDNQQLPEHYQGQFNYLIVGEDEPANAEVGATAIVMDATDSSDIYNAVAVEGDGGAVEWEVDDTPVSHQNGNYWDVLDLGASYNNKPGRVTDNGAGYDFAADNWHEPNGTEIRVNPDTQLLELVDGGVTGAKVAGKTITFDNMADVTVTSDTNGLINENLLKIAPGTYPWYAFDPDGNPAGLVPELIRKYNGVVTCLETLGRGETPDNFTPFWRQMDYYIDVENISDITPPDDGRVYTAIVADCANVADLTLIPAGKGDVDGDGYVTPVDRWLISQYRSGEKSLTPEQFLAADIDGDGSVSSFDMGLILNELANHSSTPTRAIYAEWQNGTWVLLPYSPMQTLINKKGIIFAYSKNGMVEDLKYPGALVSDGAGNVVDLGGNFPGLLQAVAGKADKSFSSVVTVNTPAFPNQPAVLDGSPLDSAFVIWTSDYYFVTLKDVDGTALPAGQFKLTKKVGGTLSSNSTDYANANEQVFYLANYNTGNGTLVDSSCVDFLQIGDNFQMRFGGSNIQINVPNKDKFRISFSGSFPQPRFDTAYPRYKLGLRDIANVTYRAVIANANYTGMLLAPLAANGNRFLHLRFDAEIIKSGNSINCPTNTRYFSSNTRDMNNAVTATANTFLGWVSKNTVNYDFAVNAINNIQMLGHNIGGTSEIILNGGTFRVDEIL